MPDVCPYPTTERRGETFSYLPPMTPERLRKQIAYLIYQGWHPAIEHTEPERTFSNFWYLWKLPMFGETSVERVMEELEACHRANPGASRASARLRQLHAVAGYRVHRLPRGALRR